MIVTRTKIPDVIVLEPRVHKDARGFFLETYNDRSFKANTGLDYTFVQDNQSRSRKGTLRGLHYQIEHAQGKLVRVSSGKIFDVAVDLREQSKTFGQWVGVELSDENQHQLWIPPGFAHGFLVLSESADLCYKTTDYWYSEHECVIRYDDVDLGITWPLLDVDFTISDRDKQGQNFSESLIYKNT